MELPTGIVVAEAIPLPREVQPLRMAKLVPNECEVGLPSQSKGDEPNQLMQCHPSVNGGRALGDGGHVSVHLSIHEPEGQALVPHQCLVMALSVGNTLLIVSEGGREEGGREGGWTTQ